MESIILTTYSKEEIKALIKECVIEALNEHKPPATKNDSDQLMNIKEVGQFLRLSVATIYGHVHNNVIPFSKRGNRLYFSKSVLVKWIQEGRRKTVSEIEKEADDYIQRKSVRNKL